MKDNLQNTLNFYKDQAQLFKELGDTNRQEYYESVVKGYEDYLKTI